MGLALFCLALFSGSETASAAEFQTQASIKNAVAEFLQENTRHLSTPAEIVVGRLDSRLRLAAAHQTMETFLAPGSHRLMGNVTVGIRCKHPKPWTLYVSAKVRIVSDVVVTSQPLSRGAKLERGNLRLARQDLATLRSGYITHLQEAVGKILKQPLSAGTPLAPHHIQTPKLVRRGEQVVIHAYGSGVKVSSSGTALTDGTAGERIRVCNLTTKRIIEGTVEAAGRDRKSVV